MNRIIITETPPIVLAIVMAIIAFAIILAIPFLPAAPAIAGTSEPVVAHTRDTRIGIVRGDTLFVTRAKVIAAALEGNEMLAASGAMKDAANAEALGAWRGFLPQVQLSEFFLRSDDALSSFGFKLQNRSVTQMDFHPDLLNNPGQTDNFITRLQLLQPIFNGGMGYYGKQAADAAGRAAAYKHQRAAESIRFHGHQAYEGLKLALTFTRVMETAVASAEGHVRQAQSMVDNEMATEADLLQAKVYLSGLKQKLIETRNYVAIAGEHIKLLTAVNSELPLSVDADESEVLANEDWADPGPASTTGRSDLLARLEEAKAAGKMVGVARGAVLPHVNLSLQRDYFDLEDPFGTNAKSWSLGVYATMGFGVGNLGEIKKAKAQHRAARHMADFESRQAGVQFRQAWLEANAAREMVQVAEEAVIAARESLRIVTNQYREGLAGMVDLLDTQAAATMAEGNLVQSRHDFNLGLANLEFSGAGSSSFGSTDGSAQISHENPADAE
ncbi:MAG: TolC family protein [Gemmatimonadales bacterium]|nr:TolC family protein [Gemmatimonadales bacterium]